MEQDAILLVGDVQGCLEPLERLLRKAGYSPDRHRLIFLGDVINRGPQSVEVLELIRHLGADVLRGNHEIRVLEALRAPEQADWLKRQAVARDLLPHPRRDELLEWIQGWPTYLEGEDWVAVHAGLHPRLSLEQTPESFLAFVRICTPDGALPPRGQWDGFTHSIPPGYQPWHHFYQGERTVYYGHWARQGLHITPRTRGLDSGCVYGLTLSAWWHGSDRLVQVEGLRV